MNIIQTDKHILCGNTIEDVKIVTPVKKIKAENIQMNTAQSQSISLKKITQIQPLELFQNFDSLMKITVDHELVNQFENPCKKLEFGEVEILGLNFQENESSMKKKPKKMISYSMQSIQLFPTTEQMIKKTENPQDIEDNCLIGSSKRFETPPKRNYMEKNSEVLMAPKKQSKYMDNYE